MQGFLLGRVLLPVPVEPDGTEHQFSAVVPAEGRLWLAGDELVRGQIALGRLDGSDENSFAAYEAADIGELLGLDANDGEADIEGLDCQDGCLWMIGSHSRRRKKARPDKDRADPQKAISRLAVVEPQRNRFLLARLPVADGVPVPHSKRSSRTVTAARLKLADDGNPLMTALAADPHLKPYVLHPGGNKSLQPAPAKENGFDIEGLAVSGQRLFIGLRGPVLVGWAIILEIAITDREDRTDRLLLAEVAGGGRLVRKHFLDLAGLGIRDLCFDDDGSLLVLAGPSMSLDGLSAVYRWQPPPAGAEDTITWKGDAALTPLFTLPIVEGGDRAEGLCRYPYDGQPALMVVYDAPAAARVVAGAGVYADIFRL
ncbi:MAG: DUF3616 domain-containing protein [Rhodospirillales bacterium]|nr:DUF3616 domain-containing protein [Rhodospirillales bacterium]